MLFYSQIGRVLGPVIVHFFIVNIVKTTGLHGDAAFLTTLAAVVSLPIFLYWFMEDQRLRGNHERKLSLADIVLLIILALVTNLVFTIVTNQFLDVFHFSNAVQERLFASNLWIQVLGIGMIVPIMEEVLFRGLVYCRLKDYNDNWCSLFLAALMFAVYHGNMVQILFAFPMSLILCLVYRKCETIYAPILFHMTVNLSSVIVTACYLKK